MIRTKAAKDLELPRASARIAENTMEHVVIEYHARMSVGSAYQRAVRM